eukprot:5002419-Prymnesium_polylepis.2
MPLLEALHKRAKAENAPRAALEGAIRRRHFHLKPVDAAEVREAQPTPPVALPAPPGTQPSSSLSLLRPQRPARAPARPAHTRALSASAAAGVYAVLSARTWRARPILRCDAPHPPPTAERAAPVPRPFFRRLSSPLVNLPPSVH